MGENASFVGDQRNAFVEAELGTLRAALTEGEDSGPPTPFDFDAFITRALHQRLDADRHL